MTIPTRTTTCPLRPTLPTPSPTPSLLNRTMMYTTKTIKKTKKIYGIHLLLRSCKPWHLLVVSLVRRFHDLNMGYYDEYLILIHLNIPYFVLY